MTLTTYSFKYSTIFSPIQSFNNFSGMDNIPRTTKEQGLVTNDSQIPYCELSLILGDSFFHMEMMEVTQSL